MGAVVGISIVTCLGMMASVVKKPYAVVKGHSIGLYWIVASVGAAILLISGLLPIEEFGKSLIADTAINPLKILVFFISMTVLSVFLDEVGLFRYLANETVKRAKTSQKALFVYLYIVVAFLTIFTSNDIIVLTFTPFICYFAKNAKINPLPYLVAEFVAANTWSMMLVIGNPTNVYLATATGINFLEYFKVMAVPSAFAGLTAFLMLYLLFRKQLSMPITSVYEESAMSEKPLLIVGIIHLSACTVLLAVSSFIGLEMWYIALAFAVSLFLCVGLYDLIKHKNPTELFSCVKRSPWGLIPFVLSMFVIVLSLDRYGITREIGNFLGSGSTTILSYGFSSMLFANLINNIPMTVLYGSVLPSLPPNYLTSGIFAAIAGSNIGAFLTPVGALAGIMWSKILKSQGVEFGFLKFVLYGLLISVPVMLASIGGLYLILGI